MITSATERIEKLLGLLLIQGAKEQSLRDRVGLLNLAGFSNIEIADLLQTSAQVVRQVLYETRKERKKMGNRLRKER